MSSLISRYLATLSAFIIAFRYFASLIHTFGVTYWQSAFALRFAALEEHSRRPSITPLYLYIDIILRREDATHAVT
jgi:hypothetical protein